MEPNPLSWFGILVLRKVSWEQLLRGGWPADRNPYKKVLVMKFLFRYSRQVQEKFLPATTD